MNKLASAHPDQKAITRCGRTNCVNAGPDKVVVKVNTIDVAELRRSIDTLLDGLLQAGVNQIEVTDRYYWKVFPDEKYRFDVKPTDLGAGDLIDDIESMGDVLATPEAGTHYLLATLASLLTYVAERASDQMASSGKPADS